MIHVVVALGAALVACGPLQMRAPWLVTACLVTFPVGCQISGAVQLTLDLPTSGDLKPTGMTTVTVVATGSDGVPTATTSVIDPAGGFTAGDVPVGTGVQLDIQLRDVSNRLVGVGEAPGLVDIAGDKTTSVTIPVRRPFVYATTASSLLSFDPTLDARDPKFQGKVPGISNPMFAVSVGGDRLAIVSANQVQAVDTSTNMVVGAPVTLPGAARDATAVPGSHLVAVAYAGGIAVVDIDAGTMSSSATSAPVDRVTVGVGTDGKRIAYGLVGRIAAPVGPVDTCTGSSQLVAADVDAPGALTAMPLGTAVSDIAADPSTGKLFATAPCTGSVDRVDGTDLVNIASLERADLVSVLGGRVWAVGSHPSTPSCLDANTNQTVKCTTTTDESCPTPDTVGSYVAYVADGAHLIVDSIPTDGGDPITFDVPGRRETIVSLEDEAREHAQVLKAIDMEPLDLVALPGGQYVSVVTRSSYFVQQLLFGGTQIVLPCLKASTGDWLLFDMASVSIASRVRTQCDLQVGPSDVFKTWGCDDPPAQETSREGDYLPTSVGALFGAR